MINHLYVNFKVEHWWCLLIISKDLGIKDTLHGAIPA